MRIYLIHYGALIILILLVVYFKSPAPLLSIFIYAMIRMGMMPDADD